MTELIEYFKKIEARLAALEAAQSAENDIDDEAINRALEELSDQMSAILTSMTRIQEWIGSYQEAQAELESRIDALESRVEFDVPDEDGFDEDEEPAVEPEPEPEPEEEEEPILPIAEPEEEDEVDEEPEIEPEPEPEVPHSVVPKVTDIKKAISLGDRFLFQRELFGGNGELMAKTIADLNKLDGLDEAEAYIDKRFSWDKESSTYELFYNILKRRW